MTSLERTLSAGSYRESLVLAAQFAADQPEALMDSLRFETNAPEGIDGTDWSSASAALRFAYEVAVREGFAPVRADIEQALHSTADSEKLTALLALVREDDLVAQRIAGTRQRDGMLPNLVSHRVSLDFRTVSSDDIDNGIELAPTVIARFEFDEHVAGQEAVVFQIPLWALEELAEDLQEARNRLTDVDRMLRTATIPKWALPIHRSGAPA